MLAVPDKKNGDNFYECWLMKENYGIAESMFGISVSSEDELIDIVSGNVNQYINFFREKYGDDLN